MSELKFYLKGAFDGDGHYNKKSSRIEINVTDYDFLEYIKELIKKEFNRDVNINNMKVYGKNSKPQFRINLTFGGQENFQIFSSIVPSTKEEKIQYLKGIWDVEGSIGMCKKIIRKKNGKTYDGFDKWLNLSQKNTNDLDLWASWLNELGIETTKLYRSDSRSRINIRKNESIKKFAELIGFRIKRKQEELDSLLKYLCHPHLSEEDKAKVVSIYTCTNFGINYIGKMFGRNKKAILELLKNKGVNTKKQIHRKINYNDIDLAETILGRELPFSIDSFKMDKFSPKGLQISKIKSIKFHSRVKGYDLHTPKYNNFFLSNGILSHNSVLAMQICQYWTSEIKRLYGKVVPFNLKDNVVFEGNKLIEKGNNLGRNYKMASIIFDEAGADLEGVKSMKQTTQAVRDFLRECGQYNMLTVLVLPDYFDLPKGVALSRSNCLINVYWIADSEGNFNRGYFKFFSKPAKKNLYLEGKRYLNYNAAPYDFSGTFSGIYTLPEEEYRELKYLALKKRESNTIDKKTMQRNIAWMLLNERFGMKLSEIAATTSNMGFWTGISTISEAIQGARMIDDAQSSNKIP